MKALILVDIQNDFLPGGALAVENGNSIIPVVNKVMPLFDLVVATQDWHPAGHLSFASNQPAGVVGQVIKLQGLDQILWPDHCVQGTPGAELAEDLDQSLIEKVVQKGTDINIDSYSGFFDNGRRHDTGMNGYLRSKDIKQVYVCGLATDYCVKYTAKDAASLGYNTTVIKDAMKAVNLKPGDDQRALNEMNKAGVTARMSDEIISLLKSQ